MAGIFKPILEASVMASVMICLVLLIRALLARSMRPGVMLMLWGLVLLRLFLPLTLTSPVNLITIPRQSIAIQSDYAPAAAQDFTPAAEGGASAPQMSAVSGSSDTVEPAVKKSADTGGDTANAPAWNISCHIWDVAAAAWVAGILATLLLFARKARICSKHLKLCAPVTDAAVLDMIRRHSDEAGIRTAAAALVCDFVHAPMVYGYFRPRILIPTIFLNMGRGSLGAILLHEVIHIRRRDILKNYIWLVAKALHWFNPLVWLAFELYEDDIELCRDYNVAYMLNTDGAFVYSMSLLEAARLSRRTAYPPSQAAALFESTGSLKTRIFRLMKPVKHKKTAAILSVLLALVMTVTCFTTACQPTPVTPPVPNKNVDIVEQVVDANKEENKPKLSEYKQAVDEQIKALGSHLDMEMQPNKQVKIVVNADIVSPGNIKIPVMRLKPKNFSKEQFEAFVKYLTNGEPLYYQTFNKQTGEMFSKEEMTAIIARIKGLLNNKDLPGNTRSAWKSRIREMENAYDGAPTQSEEKLYDGTLTVTQSAEEDSDGTITYYDSGSYTDLKCYLGKDRAAYINLIQSEKEASTQMVFDNGNYGFGYNTFKPYDGADAERLNMTYEEAKAKAEEFVRAMDGEDTNMLMHSSSIGYDLGTITNYTKETSPQCYSFSFARSYNGFVLKPVGHLWGTLDMQKDPEAYAKRVSPESMFVTIDDEGICSTGWLNQTEYIETVTEDTPLLDFNTVVDNFEQYCKQKFTWIPDDDTTPHGLTVSFNVKRVEMNLMAIPEKDNLENLVTVPVWDFIADEEFDDKEAVDVEGFALEGEKDISIVTVNAINGTIINREQGY